MTFDEWWNDNYDGDLNKHEYARLAWDDAISAERERCSKLCDEAAAYLRANGGGHEAAAVEVVALDLRG